MTMTKINWSNVRLERGHYLMEEFLEFKRDVAKHLIENRMVGDDLSSTHELKVGLNFMSEGTIGYAWAPKPAPKASKAELEAATIAKDAIIAKQMAMLEEMEKRLKAMEDGKNVKKDVKTTLVKT
jgi:hypothetical protein